MGLKVAIHQPEHFPYVGFFQKMEASDLFVILDDVQFTKNNFQNRNKFLNKNGIEEWFTIPVASDANSHLINEIIISDKSNWKRKLIAKIKQNLNIDVSEVYHYDKLLDINMSSIEFIRKRLSIKTKLIYSSSLNITGQKSARLLNICKELGADTYLSGKSGIDYLDKKMFDDANIKLEIFNPIIKDYYTTLSHLNDYENLRNIS